MTDNTLKDIKTLSAYLEKVKAKIDILKEELDDAKRYSLKLQKAKVIRVIVEELEALHPRLSAAREKVNQLTYESVQEKARFNAQMNKKIQIKQKYALKRRKIDKFIKTLAFKNILTCTEKMKVNFKGNDMRKTYMNHLCVATLAGTLFACGGGGGASATGGGGISTPPPTTSSSSGGQAATLTSVVPTTPITTQLVTNTRLALTKTSVQGDRVSIFSNDSSAGGRLNDTPISLIITRGSDSTFTLETSGMLSARDTQSFSVNQTFTSENLNSSGTQYDATNGDVKISITSLDGTWENALSANARYQYLIPYRIQTDTTKDGTRRLHTAYGVTGAATTTPPATGTATYSGTINGTQTIAAQNITFGRSTPPPSYTGDLSLNIDFAATSNQLASGAVNNIRLGGVAQDYQLTINPTNIANGRFTTTLERSNNTGVIASKFNGGFYGANASEVGGTFSYSLLGERDSKGDRPTIRHNGVFIAKDASR